jgi:hypothetical protein
MRERFRFPMNRLGIDCVPGLHALGGSCGTEHFLGRFLCLPFRFAHVRQVPHTLPLALILSLLLRAIDSDSRNRLYHPSGGDNSQERAFPARRKRME